MDILTLKLKSPNVLDESELSVKGGGLGGEMEGQVKCPGPTTLGLYMLWSHVPWALPLSNTPTFILK